jgi:hypothetical protein
MSPRAQTGHPEWYRSGAGVVGGVRKQRFSPWTGAPSHQVSLKTPALDLKLAWLLLVNKPDT